MEWKTNNADGLTRATPAIYIYIKYYLQDGRNCTSYVAHVLYEVRTRTQNSQQTAACATIDDLDIKPTHVNPLRATSQ